MTMLDILRQQLAYLLERLAGPLPTRQNHPTAYIPVLTRADHLNEVRILQEEIIRQEETWAIQA